MLREYDIALVHVPGDLTEHSASRLERTVGHFMEQGCRRVVLNMDGVAHIDSAGIGSIIAIVRSTRRNHCRLSIINVSPDVMHAFKIARIVDLVPVSAAGERRTVSELDPAVMPLWRRTLPVDAGDLHATRARVEELAKRLDMSSDDIFDLTLAVGEAIGNAADHTCGSGILATMSAYPDRVVVEVADCGGGFDEVQCQDVTSKNYERGRGIKLMRLLVDAVSISTRSGGCGMLVRLEKLR